MNNLIQFIVRNRHWFLFVILEVVSMVLLFSYNNHQNSIWVTSANSITGKIYEWSSGVSSFFSLSENNETLTVRNAVLEQQVAHIRALYNDVIGDSTLAQNNINKSLGRYNLTTAKVVGNSLSSPRNLITINRGSADSIKSDMAVVSGNGVVGIVLQTSEHYAVVMPIINVQSRISCRIRGREYFGNLQWDANDPSFSYLEDIPRYAKFEIGDSIETSGYSAIFPEGLLVGTIEDMDDAENGVSYNIRIRLAVDFACLRDVIVIDNKDLTERRRVLESTQQAANKKN